MQAGDEFDDFYKSTRTALLQQTFALTGDLPASRSAVRDAFVAAWHHWRKVSRLDDRESWVRPLAWRHAQRRHSARIFHRDRKLDPEVRATLDSLAKLPLGQRKVLLLTQLTDLPMTEIAREAGVPLHEAEQRLQTATSQLSLSRDVPTTGIRPLFEPLLAHVSDARWPRVTIVRRAGTARRRTHTAAGALAVVGALVVGGAVVTDAQGIQPSLSHARTTGVAALRLATPSGSNTPSPSAGGSATATPAALDDADLVSAGDVREQLPGSWRQVEVDPTATGILMPCQTTRYADPEGTSAAAHEFRARAAKGRPRRVVVQSVELSADGSSAHASYDAMTAWFAGCTDARVQLVGTHDIGDVGDHATLFVLRSWQRPVSTLLAAVSRTGLANTVTLTRTDGTARPDLLAAARLLGTAVNSLCHLPDTGNCAGKPKVTTTRPLATGQEPSMLSEVDLPPVAGVPLPWIGTETKTASTNLAASGCDSTSFDVKGMQHGMTRTFVIPHAKLSALFGLTETVGRLPLAQSHTFVASVRNKLGSCTDRQLGTDVVRVANLSTARYDLAVWHVTTDISDKQKVTYLMGIVRAGRNVAQVGFVPDGKVQMAPGAFISLVHRALDRLPALSKG